ncbi:MAG: hypothetical protein Q605_AUC00188G0001 [Actinomyces urogenitalis DORA_12]|uniref:Uncharacterized protein n=1 Tax=Actinomyces urogenitalis DORA_12 TaxID=1403939 RepID=W1VS03_9ACTO|nr:MAG: hypothetical protein Q605_AUC00188G0001 [Actinomyces urogenitalis DORA_12]
MPAGSSPLTRGRPSRSASNREIRRLIPAHAGSTRSAKSSPAGRSAHPRSRGVDWGLPGGGRVVIGSSPLTRGRPACSRWVRRRSPAHPRSRGVDASMCWLHASRHGSSPLTRGRRVTQKGTRSWPRLIPAHAGSTRLSWCAATTRTAHPRSRGVDLHAGWADLEHPGSSPLTRGRRVDDEDACAGVRLIPAHAGSTRTNSAPASSEPAHPRSRGVDNTPSTGESREQGSSPLTRGRRASSFPVELW